MRWLVGIVVGVYLVLALILNIPAVQRWVGSSVASVLGDIMQTEVSVGRVQIAWNGRLIVDDLKVLDRQGEEMLDVTRVAARMDYLEIPNHRIRIDNAQLFGFTAHFYQERPDTATNFQFALDAFKSKKKGGKKHPLDLVIGQILLRRGNVTWDQRWKQETPTRFNPAHLDLSNLSLTARVNAINNDSIDVDMRRLTARDRSGLEISNLSMWLTGNNQRGELGDFQLEMPHSNVSIPQLTAEWDSLPTKGVTKSWLEHLKWFGRLSAQVSPSDLKALSPQLDISPNELSEVSLQLRARGENDNLHIEALKLALHPDLVSTQLSGSIFGLSKDKQQIALETDIQSLKFNPRTVDVVQQILGMETKEIPVLTRLGTITTNGHLRWAQQRGEGNLTASTALGDVKVEGSGSKDGTIDAHVQSTGFQLGSLLAEPGKSPLGNIAMDVKAKGKIKGADGRPDLTLDGTISEIEYKGYPYRNIALKGSCQGQQYSGHLQVEDVNLALDATGQVNLSNSPRVKLLARVNNISPHALNLTDKYTGTNFSGDLVVDLAGGPLDNMEGLIRLNGFQMTKGSSIYRPGDIHIASYPDGNERHVVLTSPFLEAKVDGEFNFKNMADEIQEIIQTTLVHQDPTAKQHILGDDHMQLVLNLYNPAILDSLFGIKLQLSSPLLVAGSFDAGTRTFDISANTDGIQYGGEDLRNVDLRVEGVSDHLLGTAALQRMMKGRLVDMQLETETRDDRLYTTLSWDNKRPTPSYRGSIGVVSNFWKDPDGKQAVHCDLQRSQFVISDTTWTMHPGSLTYQQERLRVDSFRITQDEKQLFVSGRASKSDADTLRADLRGINLNYIFSFINLKAVTFKGETTGTLRGRNLFSQPYADGVLHIEDFTLNDGNFGDADININWGKVKNTISLDARITDLANSCQANVAGTICPVKSMPNNGIDLRMKGKRINLYFINKFTDAIFDDLEGRASGWARLYGPFKKLNVEGDLNVDEGSVGIPMTGVRYHLENDSVTLRPDNIYFTRAKLYDPQGHPGSEQHMGYITGHLQHQNFSKMKYDIQVEGHNVLAYDFHDFGDLSFYGTVFADGNVHLYGQPGQVNIDIKAHPTQNTVLVYNASSPDAALSGSFLTYVDRDAVRADTTQTQMERPDFTESGSNIHINFDLDVDEQSQMRILMDAKAGDYISLYGNGRMLANYYNHGAFQLYGTYHIDHGIYKLSLQEIIRKDFQIQQGSQVVFGGDPMAGTLDVKAIYTVPGVSLNDLSAKATFTNSTVRVNCLMSVTGQCKSPRIGFDFDIPNVNEDEKQMVRSLINTDEERNMQVVYLLGIGRFYNTNYDSQMQSTTAMNSLISSTLSGQINQMLSNMVGSNNWNFGANLSTGETGWSDMDVEGLLSGRLFNNRLLINGNFGYRDNPVATNNFIGDFDVQYLLTKSGSIAVKAYSETNDRYFTKSSLTTQGLGIILKKDFTRWRDVFHRHHTTKKK